MKELLLSFRSECYKPLYYGLKKYEYRRRFCQEETKCYLYLSGKEKQVVGILELGKPIRLDMTRNNYLNYPETLKRVDNYINKGDINAIPIKSLTLFKHPLSLAKLRTYFPNFMPPQMYYDLAHNPKLKELLASQKIDKEVFKHSHNRIYYDNLAVSVSEMLPLLKDQPDIGGNHYE